MCRARRPSFVTRVYTVPHRWTLGVDMLGNIIWICPLAPGTSADVLIWDGYGPSRTRGDFLDFELGGHDGVYKGRIHVSVPFIGRKNGTLTARQQCYNDVHGWFWARMERGPGLAGRFAAGLSIRIRGSPTRRALRLGAGFAAAPFSFSLTLSKKSWAVTKPPRRSGL